MANVYSSRFIETSASRADETFTCPAGFVAVVRDIFVFAAGEGSENGVLVLGALLGVIFNARNDGSADLWVTEHMRYVFTAGETITAQATAGSPSIVICGYLLTAP